MKIFPGILFVLLMAGCSKNSDDKKDTEAPAVTLNTPFNNQIFNGSQSINIAGLVTDNKYIKEIHIEVTNLNTAEEYLHVHIHPDSYTSSFNQSFYLQRWTSYKIRVIADDGSSNSTIQKVEVICN